MIFRLWLNQNIVFLRLEKCPTKIEFKKQLRYIRPDLAHRAKYQCERQLKSTVFARKQYRIDLKVQSLGSWQTKRCRGYRFSKRALSSSTAFSYIGGDGLQSVLRFAE